MNTKEAIEFINNGIDLSTKELEKEYLKKMDGIIALLKRGKEDRRILKHIRVITINEQVKDIITHTILGG